MNNLNSINIIIFFLTSFVLLSCNKEIVNENSNGNAMIAISISSSEDVDDESISSKMDQKASSRISSNIKGKLPFSDYTQIEYSFNEESKQLRSKVQDISGELKAVINRKPLGGNILYKVLVYDQNGDFVTERNYNYGSESTVNPLLLDSDKIYTFLSFSLNSSSILPNILEKEKLSTVKLSNVSEDLMTFRKTMKLTFGTNLLSIILKHRYNRIITQLTADPSTVGTFNKISNASIRPAFDNATYSFANDTFQYGTQKQNGCPVIFASNQLGTRNVISNPTLVISPLNINGSINFGTISIDDETKTNFSIPNVKLTPGVSYTLKLNFRTCTENVGSVQGMNWNYQEAFIGKSSGIWKDGVFYYRGQTISKTIIAPGADYGFVFDITDLDNAFNMELNGVRLAASEIQFERGASSAQNIRFKDKSLYQGINSEGGNNIAAIYNMKGTVAKPLVKVVIGKNGEVTLYGSKISGGPLYELELFNGNYFNTFKWNTASQGNNVIKVTQLVDGRTILIGNGSGKKKIPCS